MNQHGPLGQREVLALCDEAFTVTLIEETIKNELGLTGSTEPSCLQWTTEKILMQENYSERIIKISRPGR